MPHYPSHWTREWTTVMPDTWVSRGKPHPAGPADIGAICIVCQKPVKSAINAKALARRCCSSRCLKWLDALIDDWTEGDGEEPLLELRNPRVSPPGRRFGMDPHHPTVPFEYEGFGPLPGDSLERFGTVTTYRLATEADFLTGPAAENLTARKVVIAEHESGELRAFDPDDGGDCSRFLLRASADDFTADGARFAWCLERVEQVTSAALEFSWEAWVPYPARAIEPKRRRGTFDVVYESPEVDQYRRRMRRNSRARASATDRGASRVDEIDVFEVFARDDWICQLCFESVDPGRNLPDRLAATLDHRIPVSRGGDHVSSNVQLAHAWCNYRKGARLQRL